MFDILIAFGAFAFLGFVVREVTGLIGVWMMHRTIREALKSHPESVPDLSARLRPAIREHPLFSWALIAVAVTIAAIALFRDETERMELLQLALVPLVIGMTMLLYLRFARREVHS